MTDTSLLRFGTLELTGAGDGFTLQALGVGAGMDLGAPQPLTKTMQSFVQDGSIVATTGHDDRTLTLVVRVTADDAAGLSRGSAALVEQCRKTWYDALIVPVQWTPPTDVGPVTVWKCTAAHMELANWDDLREVWPDLLGRIYKLVLTCNPWGFADTQVTETIPAPTSSDPVTPTVTSIDTCGSTTGWSAYVLSGGAPTLSTGTTSEGDTYVQSAQSGGATNASTFGATRSGLSQDMSSSPYLMVRAAMFGPAGATLTYSVNGTLVTPVASSGSTVFLPFSGTLNSVTVAVTWPGGLPSGGSYGVRVFDLSRTDMIAAGTLTQLEVARQFAVQGSVRTPATIALRGVDVSDGSDKGLGQVIVYTTLAQNVATPPLRAVRVDGGSETTDATAYSGKASALSTEHRFQQPVASIASSGYELPVRVKAASTGEKSLTWTAKTIMGDETVSDVQTGTVTIDIATANTWQISFTDLLRLPPKLAGSAGVIEISLYSTTLTLDDAWLADDVHGQLTVVDCGENTRLWIDAATFDHPVNTVWVGNAEDRSDSYIADALPAEQHEVAPPVTNVFVASGAPPDVSLTYTPAGYDFAPEVEDVA